MLGTAMGGSVAHIINDEKASGFTISGQARCMAANRVSHYLNLNGPSFILDENWNGSFAAIKGAMEMIENGHCEAAIVGGASLSIDFSVQDLMEARGVICKDGKTKPYTQQADGYSRGDSLIVLFLQRADMAKRNYVSILYTDACFNGNNNDGYSAFYSDFFEKFLQDCYDKSGIDPEEVSYLEVDGCAVKHLDEMELAAVERIFCKNRKTPLQIGSVRTNIGHVEAACVLSSLVKIIIAMETGTLPAHLNFKLEDTKIPALINRKLEVVTENREWTGDIAAINGLGITSTYGHMIVRRTKQNKTIVNTGLPFLVFYSTRTIEGIKKINEKVLAQSPDFGYMKLVQDVFSKTISGHLYRGYTAKSSENKQGFQHFSGVKPPIWFVYSGMGSQWKTMGRDLIKISVFAESINKSHSILRPKGVDLLKIILEDDAQIFDNILNSFVGIAAVQIGLTDLLESIGISPDGLIGHSVGELGCAYADKCLTADQMILSAYYRGKASLEADLVVGMMAAIGIGYSAMKKLCPDSIEVACHNSADSCTISGPAEDVKKLVQILQAAGIFARLVNVSNIAYHSKYIKPAAPLLLSYLNKIIPQPKERSRKWISTSVNQNLWETDLAKKVSPEYLTNNLLSSVLFEEGLPFIPGNAVLIEIAPHGLLQAILKRALPEEVFNISLTKKETNCLEFLFNSLGELYINGIDFNASHLYPDVSLPVPRGTRSLCSLVEWAHEFEWSCLTYTHRCGAWEKSIRLNSNDIFNLNKNVVNNRIIIPFSMFFEYIADLINRIGDVKMITLKDIFFKNQLEMAQDNSTLATIMYQPGSGHFEISIDEELILSGTAIKNEDIRLPLVDVGSNKKISIIEVNNFYKHLNMRGYDYPDENKLISDVTLFENGLRATISHTKDIGAFLSSAFQIHLFNKNGNEMNQQILLPKYIREVHVNFEDFKNAIQDYSVDYYNKTGAIQSDCGIYISGIEYEEMKLTDTDIKVESLKFVPYLEEHIQDIETGLHMLLKIIVENTHGEDLIIVELKEKHSPKYLPYIEKYLQKRNMRVETNEINDTSFEKIEESSLTIVSGQFLDIIPQILSKVNSYVLLCFQNDQSINISENYIEVAHFYTKNSKFFLIKQANFIPVEVINIEDEKISYEKMQTHLWATILKNAVTDQKKVYIACISLPAEGIDEFVEKMRNVSNTIQKCRYLFLLDSGAPKCEPESEFYAHVFKEDLTVQVLKNGSWGNFIDTSKSFEESYCSDILSCALKSSNLLKICKPTYLGLHLNDLTRTESNSIPNEIGALDFSGINNKGQQIMGFGQFEINQRSLIIDPELTWPIPEGWTLSDAATVPYAYTLAYYSLFIIADLRTEDIILIHGGTSEIGLAALFLAINSRCHVYTTVQSDSQRKYLKDVSRLSDMNILDCSTDSYVKRISLITHGNGVQVILNCLPGIDNIEGCKSSISRNGRIIQLANSALKQYNTTGMGLFIGGISFIGLTGQRLLQLPQDMKHQLREMVADGIQKKHIQPLSRIMIEEEELVDGLRFLRSNNSIGAVLTKLNINCENFDVIKNSSSIIRNQGSYLIYANSSDGWFFLIDWLVNNGAKRIIIASIPDRSSDFVKRYISLIEKKYNAEIIISKYNATTSESAEKMVHDIGYSEQINGTFILAMSEDTDKYGKIVGNIYDSLHQNKNQERIVVFVGRNKQKVHMRENGLNICNIAWSTAYTLQDIIRNLHMILKKNSTNVYLKNDSVQNLNEAGHSLAEDYSSFLPSSLKVLKQLSRPHLKSPEMLKLSYIPKAQDDSSPLFIVPGLSGEYSPSLRKFADQALYPVYCVSLPTLEGQDNIVEIIAQQIISIDSPKVYRLVGITWGTMLTLEIAKMLESLGKRVEVYLIDGIPEIIKNFTNHFYVNGKFSSSLLEELIKIDGKSLKYILSSSDLPEVDKKDIIRSLMLLRNHIKYSNFYKPLKNKICGHVTLILPESTSQEYTSLSEHSENFRCKVLKVNRRNILRSKNLIEFLHETIDIIFI